ncbi:3-deoxy-D-manno-octulosonic acid transferase [Lunatimonas salinarum]|uniref:3-deoxy-D-manno-octulosonic acid transferase n=1 Tax=Lunatimonas salinarum TaxID=1774590 RepID=UPI001ADF2141|nr:glycosyltransferase N-terminal domain-containing protein [Lunatimonas salinarum]
MRQLYNLGMGLLAIGLQVGSWRSTKLRQMVQGRMGLFERLRAFRNTSPGPLAWFHVASLGEYEQAKPVIRAFRESRPQWQVVVSFFSPSGYEHVIKRPQPHVDFITYLPIDSPGNARRFLQILYPNISFFVKYDLWANHILAAKSLGVPLFLIAAAFREQQVYFNKTYGGFFRRMLGHFDHVFTQQPLPAAMIERLGLKSVSVAGDPRYDNVNAISQSPKSFPEVSKGIAKPVLVGGSVWQEDMDRIIPFICAHPEYQYILAPHDIHAKAIEEWISALPGKTLRYTHLDLQDPQPWDTLIIDNIGMLSSLYQYARVAYVGGAFGKGLHNILEPLAFRIPVIFGRLKQRGKFPEWEISQNYGCGFAVQTAADFESVMTQLTDETTYERASLDADRLLNDNLGSARKIMEIVNQKLTNG